MQDSSKFGRQRQRNEMKIILGFLGSAKLLLEGVGC
jgi:hypothetical protein